MTPYRCDACGDLGASFLKVGRRRKHLCAECACELIDGEIRPMRVPESKTPCDRPSRKPLGGYSRGEEYDSNPWRENAVRALEGD